MTYLMGVLAVWWSAISNRLIRWICTHLEHWRFIFILLYFISVEDGL